MVQAVVAGVGGLFGLIGAILVIVAAVSENFVVVTFPPVTECDTNYLGTLGFYTATYDPACAKDDPSPEAQALQAFGRTESPVTEFWPLFPAQTNFGGAFGEAAEGDEFTTCEEFYAAGGPAQRVAAGAGVDGLKDQLSEGFAEQYETLTVTVDTVADGTNLFLKGFVAGTAIPDAFNETVNKLQEAAAGAGGAIAVLNTILGGVGCTAGPTFLSPFTGCGSISSYFNESIVTLEGGPGAGWPSILAAGEAGLTDLTIGSIATALGFGAAPTSFQRTQIEQILGAVGLHSVAGLIDGTTPLTDVVVGSSPGPLIFGDVANKEALTDDLTSVAQAVGAIYASGPEGAAAFGGAVTAFGLCPSGTTPISVPACAAATLAGPDDLLPLEPAGLNDLTPSPLCLVASQSPLFATTAIYLVANPLDCTYLDFLLAIPDVLETGLVPLPAAFAGINATVVFPLLKNLLTSCSVGPVTFNRCVTSIYNPLIGSLTPADQVTIPEELDAPLFALCNGLDLQGLPFACAASPANYTFRNFINLFIATNALGADPSGVTAASLSPVFAVCAGVPTWSACKAVLTSDTENALVLAVQAGLAGAALERFPGHNTTTEEIIKNCNDDLKDKEVFERAQKLVPVCIVLSALGAILAVAAGVLNKTPVAFVAGGFMVFGGVLLLITLLLVRSAPVYGLVGGEPTNYEPLYKPSTGQGLALGGVALPVVGGIMLVVSAFLNKPGAEDALSNKVDAA